MLATAIYSPLLENDWTPDEIDSFGLKQDDLSLQENIACSLEMELMDVVGSPSTAYELWNTICKRFDLTLNLGSAQVTLYSCVIQDGNTIR